MDSWRTKGLSGSKKHFTNTVDLLQPDWTKGVTLDAYGSNEEPAEIFAQNFKKDNKSTAFDSKKLLDHELKYSIGEKKRLFML